MNSLNVANDNVLATTEANDTAVLAALATTEANDTAAVAGSSIALSKWASLSSYELNETGQASEGATPLAAFIGAGLFDLQGNTAQFDLQRKTPMPGSDELTDAKIEAAEARTDTKIVRLEGKMDLVIVKLDAVNENTNAMRHDVKDSERAIKANAWIIFAALAAIIIGLAATIPAVFDWGFKTREVIDKAIQAYEPPVNSAPPSTH